MPRVSISTLQQTEESPSHAGFGDTWPCEDSVFQLFPVRASHRWCQLQPRQLDQGRSHTGCCKYQRRKCLIQCFPRGEEDKSSPGKHPIPCSVLEHEDAYSLQLLAEKELSSLWDPGRAIPLFSGSLGQEGPEATCNSSLLPFCILKGKGFSNLSFPSSLKENHSFQGKPWCLNSVHWLLQSSLHMWTQVCRISEERVHIFDVTSTGRRFKLCWLSEEEVDDLPHTRKQTAWQG